MTSPMRFGRYVLDERIGAGGMAEVYRGRLVGVDGFEKLVCVKRILPHLAQAPDFAAMFRDEASIAARLQHGNIVQIFDFGDESGSLYIAMEFVDGVSLARVLQTYSQRGERIPVPAVLKVGVEMCKGLHTAHTAMADGKPLGIVHRDVTPHNILLSKAGEVKVADFGVARADGRRTQTQTGIIKGKLQYMSPEQALGQKYDHRLDQFATGICLWEALTGRRLFKGDSEFLILEAVTRAQVPRPSEMRPDVPAKVNDVIARALQKDPAKRFRDMAELESALDDVLFSVAKSASALDLKPIVARCIDKSPPRDAPPTVSVKAPRPPDIDSDPFDESVATQLTRSSGAWVKPGDTPQMGAESLAQTRSDSRSMVTRPPIAMRSTSSPSADPSDTRATSSTRANTSSTLVAASAPTLLAHEPRLADRGGRRRLAIAGGVVAVVVIAIVAVVAAREGEPATSARADGCPAQHAREGGVCVPTPSVAVGASGLGSSCGTHDELVVAPSKNGIAWVSVVRPTSAGEAKEVRVVVRRTDPIGLVLAAESAVTWRIEAMPDARIDRVVLVSGEPQSIEGKGSYVVDDMSGRGASVPSFTAAGIVSAVERKVGGLKVESSIVCPALNEVAIVPPRAAPTPLLAQTKRPRGIAPAFAETESSALNVRCDGGNFNVRERVLRYAATGERGKPEVHVVGAGTSAGVRVTSTRSEPHVIVLAGGAPVTWKIDRGAASGLTMVVLTGAKGQTVSGADGDVRLVDLAQGQTIGWRWPELDTSSSMSTTFAYGEQESGGRITSYIGCEMTKSVTIGDGDIFGTGAVVAGAAQLAELADVRDRIALIAAPPEKCRRGCPDPVRLSGFAVFDEAELDEDEPLDAAEVRKRLEAAIVSVDDVKAMLSATERCKVCASD